MSPIPGLLELDRPTADRPPIAHLVDEPASRYRGERVAICGTLLRGIDAPDHADRCVVCLDLDGAP